MRRIWVVVLDSGQALQIVSPSFSQLWLGGGGMVAIQVLPEYKEWVINIVLQNKFQPGKIHPDVNKLNTHYPNVNCIMDFLKIIQQNLLVVECDIVFNSYTAQSNNNNKLACSKTMFLCSL